MLTDTGSTHAENFARTGSKVGNEGVRTQCLSAYPFDQLPCSEPLPVLVDRLAKPLQKRGEISSGKLSVNIAQIQARLREEL